MHGFLAGAGLDDQRAALFGGSYGGYMVLAGLAFQPELWAAGVDLVGISDLATFLENTSDYRRAHREREYGSLEHDREFLARASPLRHAGAIRAPLFVVHGRNDPRVPVSEAEQLVTTVRQHGVRCELVIYEDEGHGLARLQNRLDAYPPRRCLPRRRPQSLSRELAALEYAPEVARLPARAPSRPPAGTAPGPPTTPGAAAGYSGTPPARKLGIKADQRVLLYAAPTGWTIDGLPRGVSIVRRGRHADVVVAFFRDTVDLARNVGPLGEVIRPAGSLWLAWPRRAGGHASNITDNVIREIVLPSGMVDVKVAALDQDWSALKFVWRKELRQ